MTVTEIDLTGSENKTFSETTIKEGCHREGDLLNSDITIKEGFRDTVM